MICHFVKQQYLPNTQVPFYVKINNCIDKKVSTLDKKKPMKSIFFNGVRNRKKLSFLATFKYSDSITRFALSTTLFPVRQIVSISFAHEAKKLLLTLLQTP